MGEQSTIARAESREIDILDIVNFYGNEAMLLDEMRFEEWFRLLSEDILYEMPVRTVLKDVADEFDTGAYRFRDRLPHIRMRIDRLGTGHAWAEEPPSRVVRSVGSIFASGVSQSGRMLVKSAVVLCRHRGQNRDADILAYRRCDELVQVGDELRLAYRRILMPDNVLNMAGITIFL